MKLNRDVVQISSTAIITSLVLVTLHFITGTEENTVSILSSDTISKARSDALRKEYTSFKNVMWVKYKKNPNDKTDSFAVLQGFRFKATDLDTIINHNYDGVVPDDVIFYFGKDSSFRRPWKLRQNANMHIIAIGVKNNKLLEGTGKVNAVNVQAPSIYDKADPCPPHCAVSP